MVTRPTVVDIDAIEAGARARGWPCERTNTAGWESLSWSSAIEVAAPGGSFWARDDGEWGGDGEGLASILSDGEVTP